MMVMPAGVMPDKPMPVDTLVDVLKRRLRGEKDVSVRRFLRAKIRVLAERPAKEKDPDPFLIAT